MLVISMALNVYLILPEGSRDWTQIFIKRSSRDVKSNGVNSSNSSSVHNSTVHYTLAVMIVSAPANQDRRNVLRNTWLNGYEQRKYHVRFVIGTGNLTDYHTQDLIEENSTHHDIILLDLEDHYEQLSHKVLAGLVWFARNIDFSYLLKCDDDSFALLDKIESDLHQRNHTHGLYWGYFVSNARPFTEGKFAEPEWKFCDHYFPYAFGGGYVLSADVVHRIAHNADALIVYNNEDVSVSAWTISYDIERRHDVRFDTAEVSRGCRNTFLVTHKQSIQDMKQKHAVYVNSGIICKEET